MTHNHRIELIALFSIGILLSILNILWFSNDFIWGLSAVILSVVWLITLFDIIKQNVHNKSFWLLSMFFLAPLAIIFYLIRRERLILL